MEETSKAVVVRKAIDVTGIVQGVGFRPFVYRLAHEYTLSGLIANTPAGVTIEVQGECELIDQFLARLQSDAPPLAKITSLSPREIELTSETDFRIVSSRLDTAPRALISPASICAVSPL